MKKIPILLALLGIVMLIGVSPAMATITGTYPPPKFEFPMLLSNAGQGPDGKGTRTIINFNAVSKEAVKYEVDYFYNAEPQPADIAGYRTIIFAISSSAKGLGASGITIEQEIARLNKVVDEAKKLGIKIVALCLQSGTNNRGLPGSAAEQSIDAIAPYADYIIVHKAADSDGRFTSIAAKNKVPITYFDNGLTDIPQIVTEMFSK
ncbi:MAG: hypothetical protein GX183_04955 [Firmicutes bacterium]|jgi:hypothetical protein|nr:hypothetical protein [Bacillota bacterium]